MPVPCVGAVVLDGTGRLLLVRRGRPPQQGTWSLPGGRVEPGETDTDAVAREVAEETGLSVRVGRLAGRVLRAGPQGSVYDIGDYLCEVTSGELRAGDDAADVRWVAPAELATLTLSTGLVDALTEWGVLRPPGG
jgi:8-oxo-dGTP diphosphatase